MSFIKLDGWMNLFTKLGSGSDNRTSYTPIASSMSQEEIENLYACDPVAGKIVDYDPEQMIDGGIEFIGDEDIKLAVTDKMEQVNLSKTLFKALKYANLYGGSAILPITNDLKFDSELKLENVTQLINLRVLNRFQLIADTDSIIWEPDSKYFGLPEFYKIKNAKSEIKVHTSRLIKFIPDNVGEERFKMNGYWGDSILNKLNEAIRDYAQGCANSSKLLQDLNIGVMQIEDLRELIANGKEDLVKTRARLIDKCKSIAGMILTDAKEQFTFEKRDVTGVNDLINIQKDRIQVGTKIPHTKLWGQSPSGLGATGNSEQKDYAKHISAQRKLHLDDPVNTLLTIIVKTLHGPDNWSFKYLSTDSQTNAEILEEKEKQAKIDESYCRLGVLDPEEIRNSRFANNNYSFETSLESKLDGELDDMGEDK